MDRSVLSSSGRGMSRPALVGRPRCRSRLLHPLAIPLTPPLTWTAKSQTQNATTQTFLPLDLRVKQTRALRRALTKEQKAKKLAKEAKRAAAFPTRKYALKA